MLTIDWLKFYFQISFVLYLIFNINIYSRGFNLKTAHQSEMKNNKIVNRTAQWKYLNKILNIQTLTSKLYRKWYYVES